MLSCFYASAFGFSDVDIVFSKINELLEKKGISVYRVDKVNHNNNIDQEILQLIDECDFSICDLTYARPSVYYEAGYISGQKKQILYIARDDHFSYDINDTHGNKRIHFDLKMKNIIKWSINSDFDVFLKQVDQRIDLLTVPLLSDDVKAQIISEKRKAFDLLSPYMKMSNLRYEINRYIVSNYEVLPRRIWDENVSRYFITGNKDLYIILIEETVSEKFLKSSLLAFRFGYWPESFFAKYKRYFNSYHYIVISLREIKREVIDNAFPSSDIIRPSEIIKLKTRYTFSYMHFISCEKSMMEYLDRIDEHIKYEIKNIL
jgi:nucleoside 2-deoxyribosyltransferase